MPFEITDQTATIALLALISVGLPLYMNYDTEPTIKRILAGEPGAKLKTYRTTIIMLWGSALLILAFFGYTGKAFADLGLTFQFSIGSIGNLIIALGISAFYYRELIKVKNDKKAQEGARKELSSADGIIAILPTTIQEYRMFNMMALTAGITEEIIFRGFLIWGFSLYTNVYVASLLALLSFVAGHLYQKTVANLIKVGAIGGLLTLPFIVSGSILPSIIMHIAIDLVGGAVAWHMFNLPKLNTLKRGF